MKSPWEDRDERARNGLKESSEAKTATSACVVGKPEWTTVL